jgi:hypothetical protein
MRRTIGRRAAFFAVIAAVSAVLVPATPPEFRWVAWFAAGLAAFWAIALGAEELASGNRGGPREPVQPVGGTPFDPPASPGTVRRGGDTDS